MRAKIIAVDFDGTLIEEGKWPGIGATNEKVLNYCKDEQTKGTRIILWTNRVGEPLETAIKWCEEHGLRLDAVNDNVPEAVEFFGTNTRKIYADEFIDDRMAQGFNLPYYGEPKIKELTDEELIVLYREKYFDERDPIINYWPHETIPTLLWWSTTAGSRGHSMFLSILWARGISDVRILYASCRKWAGVRKRLHDSPLCEWRSWGSSRVH